MAIARPIRVLLVDDHTLVRQGLRSALQAYPNIDVVGEAGDGEEAVASATKLLPAVVVMDINMSKMDGFAGNTYESREHVEADALARAKELVDESRLDKDLLEN